MMENWTVIETLEDAHDIKIIARAARDTGRVPALCLTT